eukprot:COSAG05_NODE_14355_length_399_cov_0.750000_1_plen_38_part_10
MTDIYLDIAARMADFIHIRVRQAAHARQRQMTCILLAF